eukprot:TRINITY_DN66312_c7_g1_i1.p1 TRINITY_DN66312_c7_g1~~TRINITY_DN66312_c7_g1_i1.p1  ORF type:complete len:828 (-),score=149.43 TRINITY_DN66312_c7_g1_i1:30-2513(-)
MTGPVDSTSFLSLHEIESLHNRISSLHQALGSLEQEEREEQDEADQRRKVREDRRLRLLEQKSKLAPYLEDSVATKYSYQQNEPQTGTLHSPPATDMWMRGDIFRTDIKTRRQQHMAHLKDWKQHLQQLGATYAATGGESAPHKLVRKRRDAALDSFDRLGQKITLENRIAKGVFQRDATTQDTLKADSKPASPTTTEAALPTEIEDDDDPQQSAIAATIQEILMKRELRIQKEKERMAEIAEHRERLLQLQMEASRLEMEALNDMDDSASAMSGAYSNRSPSGSAALTMGNLRRNSKILERDSAAGSDRRKHRKPSRQQSARRASKMTRYSSAAPIGGRRMSKKPSMRRPSRHEKDRWKFDDVSFTLSSDLSDGSYDLDLLSSTDDESLLSGQTRQTYRGPTYHHNNSSTQPAPLPYGNPSGAFAAAYQNPAAAAALQQQQQQQAAWMAMLQQQQMQQYQAQQAQAQQQGQQMQQGGSPAEQQARLRAQSVMYNNALALQQYQHQAAAINQMAQMQKQQAAALEQHRLQQGYDPATGQKASRRARKSSKGRTQSTSEASDGRTVRFGSDGQQLPGSVPQPDTEGGQQLGPPDTATEGGVTATPPNSGTGSVDQDKDKLSLALSALEQKEPHVAEGEAEPEGQQQQQEQLTPQKEPTEGEEGNANSNTSNNNTPAGGDGDGEAMTAEKKPDTADSAVASTEQPKTDNSSNGKSNANAKGKTVPPPKKGKQKPKPVRRKSKKSSGSDSGSTTSGTTTTTTTTNTRYTSAYTTSGSSSSGTTTSSSSSGSETSDTDNDRRRRKGRRSGAQTSSSSSSSSGDETTTTTTN